MPVLMLCVLQMNLLDRAIKLAAEQDEPEEMNYVRKHAIEQARLPALLLLLRLTGSKISCATAAASCLSVCRCPWMLWMLSGIMYLDLLLGT